jgi:hypothetical protein
MGLVENTEIIVAGTMAIKEAIRNKDVDIPNNTPFEDIPDYIGQIQQGGGSEPEEPYEFEPNPDWWDIKEILANSRNDYGSRKSIYLMASSAITTSFTTNQTSFTIETSDGKIYTSSTTHTWDASKDKPVYDKDGNVLYKTRYFIVYTRDTYQNAFVLNSPLEIIWCIHSGQNMALTYHNGRPLLECVEFINGAKIHDSITDISGQLNSNFALKQVVGLHLNNVINASTLFQANYSLRKVELLYSEKLENGANMFNNCYSLDTIIGITGTSLKEVTSMFSNTALKKAIPMNTNKITTCSSLYAQCHFLEEGGNYSFPVAINIGSLYSYCKSLIKAYDIYAPLATTTNTIYQYCPKLKNVPKLITPLSTNVTSLVNYSAVETIDEIDVTSASTVAMLANLLTGSQNLRSVKIKNLKVSMNLSTFYALSKASILYLFENAQDLTGQSAQTITLTPNMKAQLTPEELEIATDKNFLVA